MNDNYSHNSADVIYVTGNIPGPAEDSVDYKLLMGEYNSLMLGSCLCREMCVRITCKCLQMSHGDNYEHIMLDGILKYRLRVKPNVYTHYPILECNSNCLCSAACGNRLVQSGPMEGLIVKPCDDEQKGLGLFAPGFILKGQFICEYAGELLTKSQAIERSKQNEVQGNMNYIMCLNEHTYDGIIQTFVDPSKFGNIGRYINHSCEPNSFILPVRSESAIPHLAIFSCKDIKQGEEITINYSRGSKIDQMVLENKLDSNRKTCLCKSATCKALLPYDNF